MQTTPNLGLTTFSGDGDGFDEMLIAATFLQLDALALSRFAVAKLWDSVDAGVTFPTATFSTSSLDQGYRHLDVVCQLVSSAGLNDFVVQCNGDTGAHYIGYQTYEHGAAPAWSGTETPSGATQMKMGLIGAIGSAVLVTIPTYSAAVAAHLVDCTYSAIHAASTNNVYTGKGAGAYIPAAPAAIASLTFGSGFAAGTRVTVYGRK